MTQVPEAEEIEEFFETYDLDKDDQVSFEEILKADEGLRKEEEGSEDQDQARHARPPRPAAAPPRPAPHARVRARTHTHTHMYTHTPRSKAGRAHAPTQQSHTSPPPNAHAPLSNRGGSMPDPRLPAPTHRRAPDRAAGCGLGGGVEEEEV